MSNYIALIETYDTTGFVTRRTQVNIRNWSITDLESARAGIKAGLEREEFDYTEKELQSYYIVQLTKVEDRVTTTASPDSETTLEVEKNAPDGDERSSDD